jgi:hypothetical protein
MATRKVKPRESQKFIQRKSLDNSNEYGKQLLLLYPGSGMRKKIRTPDLR